MLKLKEIFLNLCDLRQAIYDHKVACWVYEFVVTWLVLISLFTDLPYVWVLSVVILPVCLFDLAWSFSQCRRCRAEKDEGDDRG